MGKEQSVGVFVYFGHMSSSAYFFSSSAYFFPRSD